MKGGRTVLIAVMRGWALGSPRIKLIRNAISSRRKRAPADMRVAVGPIIRTIIVRQIGPSLS